MYYSIVNLSTNDLLIVDSLAEASTKYFVFYSGIFT